MKSIDEYHSSDDISDRIIELLNKGERITEEERDEMTDLAQATLVIALVKSTGIDVNKAIDIIDKAGTLRISHHNGDLEITQTAVEYDEHDDSQTAITIEERTS